jgi:deoxyribonuclease V
MPIACLDVHYVDPRATAACVVLPSWQASEPQEFVVRTIDKVMPYKPGAFYRRELPCIEEALKALRRVPEILVVDGYVWLGQGKKGLGAYLFETRGNLGAVVGIAKTRLVGAEPVGEVLRGQSRRPLFVSAVGWTSRRPVPAYKRCTENFACLGRCQKLIASLVSIRCKADLLCPSLRSRDFNRDRLRIAQQLDRQLRGATDFV